MKETSPHRSKRKAEAALSSSAAIPDPPGPVFMGQKSAHHATSQRIPTSRARATQLSTLGESAGTATEDNRNPSTILSTPASTSKNLKGRQSPSPSPVADDHSLVTPKAVSRSILGVFTTQQRPDRDDDQPRTCSNDKCCTQIAKQWRHGPAGELLCNACGLWLKRHETVRDPDAQPAAKKQKAAAATQQSSHVKSSGKHSTQGQQPKPAMSNKAGHVLAPSASSQPAAPSMIVNQRTRKAFELITSALSVQDMKNLRSTCKGVQEALWKPFSSLFRTVEVFVEGRSTFIANYKHSNGETPGEVDVKETSEEPIVEETSLRILGELSEHEILAPAVQEIRLVVCRWKREDLPRDEATGILAWDYDGEPYTMVDHDMRESNGARSAVLYDLLAAAITPSASGDRSGFQNLALISIGDKDADRALGYTEFRRRMGLVPNTLFADYVDSLDDEKAYYEVSLLRAFIIAYHALKWRVESSASPLRSLSIDSSNINRTFRGLPLQLLNLSDTMVQSLKPGFQALTKLNLQINAGELSTGPGTPCTVHDGKETDVVNSRPHRYYSLGKILDMCQNLTQLHLQMDGGELVGNHNGYTDYLSFLLNDLTLTHLADFSLVGQSAPLASIKSFVARHARTLKRLEFGRMALPYGDSAANVPDQGTGFYWYKVLESLLLPSHLQNVKPLTQPVAVQHLQALTVPLTPVPLNTANPCATTAGSSQGKGKVKEVEKEQEEGKTPLEHLKIWEARDEGWVLNIEIQGDVENGIKDVLRALRNPQRTTNVVGDVQRMDV